MRFTHASTLKKKKKTVAIVWKINAIRGAIEELFLFFMHNYRIRREIGCEI